MMKRRQLVKRGAIAAATSTALIAGDRANDSPSVEGGNLPKMWSKLPVEYQEIFKIAAMSANLDMLSKYEALNRKALKTLIDSGTKLKSYPTGILQSAQQAAAEYYTEESNNNPAFKKIFDQWSQFRTAIFDWNEINESSYTSFVYK